MAEMQQASAVELRQVPATPVAPAAPGTTVPTPTTGQTPPPSGAPTANLDLGGYSANQLRRMLQELKNQRQELADRRQSIGGTYEGASGANRDGIGQRILELDKNIVSYEREIFRVGQAYAAKAGGETRTFVDVGQSIPSNYVKEDEAAGMAFGFSFMTAIVVFFVTRRLMRRKYAGVTPMQQPNLIASNERLDRIETAVDSIAIEVERVSENQRFMTRLMTETQLGDTIKDVRKSAELAKSAAESPG